MTRLALRRFNYSDQMNFASVSGDRNPMHLDALKARRTQAGAPVVHGVHMLLWAIESFAATQPGLSPLRSLRAQFSKFVYLRESVEVLLTQQGADGARLSISVDGAARAKVSIVFGEPEKDCVDWSVESMNPLPIFETPDNLAFDQISGLSGSLAFQMSPQDAAEMFPAATRWLGASRVSAMAASTYLVGMVCPGLHSIYSELAVTACRGSAPRNSLAFRVTESDSRFRSIVQEICGGELTGTVKGFARTAPVEQAPMASLTGLVTTKEFAGSVALVVGGSRGLGELTAKLIAAGGGRVIVTWQTGKNDAERVVKEIRLVGGVCEALRYDACEPSEDQVAMLVDAPTHFYFFATPAIFRPHSEIFTEERLQEFLAIYVNGFWQLSQAIRARQPKLSIFYPSSISVTERPRGMTEYTMAKSAGEVLCADMNVSQAPLHVTVSRLPRLATDQTASVAATETIDPIEIMLPIIREVQSWPR